LLFLLYNHATIIYDIYMIKLYLYNYN